MCRVGLPLGDVNAGGLADIHPIARETQRRTGSYVHTERPDVEVPGRVDVVRQDQIMFHLRQRHVKLLPGDYSPVEPVCLKAGTSTVDSSSRASGVLTDSAVTDAVLLPSRRGNASARPCGVLKSNSGPIGMMPVGLMLRWLP